MGHVSFLRQRLGKLIRHFRPDGVQRRRPFFLGFPAISTPKRRAVQTDCGRTCACLSDAR